MARKLVDLFSDTATQPTEGMLRAMATAPLGDEQRGNDPTVTQLENRMAELLEMKSGLFVPTATMANQIALAVHCRPGDEVICHRTAHILNFEGGGNAANSGVQSYPLDGPLGIFDGNAVRAAMRSDEPHQPATAAVVVENTSNGGGGTIWPDAEFNSVVEACRNNHLALHVDGARLFNAAVARAVSPAHWTRHADSAQTCFSKGLGCPFGAVLTFKTEANAHRARRIKQRLGGALRQAGIAAGAMLYALDHHIERLADDHRRAQTLATALRKIPGFEVEPVATNLVYFRPGQLSASNLATELLSNQVAVSVMSTGQLRACTHLGVDDQDIEWAIEAFRQIRVQ